MTIYELLTKLTLAAARGGMLDSKDAFEGVNLIRKLEAANAFGTISAITNGEFGE